MQIECRSLKDKVSADPKTRFALTKVCLLFENYMFQNNIYRHDISYLVYSSLKAIFEQFRLNDKEVH